MKAKHIVWNVAAMMLLSACTEPAPLSEEKPDYTDYTETAFGLDMEMVYVKGGTFRMGGTEEQGEDTSKNEFPIRNVRLDSYHIGKYEVTQAQWEAVMGTTLKEQNALAGDSSTYYGEGDDYPMYYITIEEALIFCRNLSRMTGKRYGLPTEAQWEYAARGGNKSRHFKYAGSNDIDEVAWYMATPSGDPAAHPVGMKKANELGLYDMSGNVSEFCSDSYIPYYDAGDTINPQRVLAYQFFVVRGGGREKPISCRVSYRGSVQHYTFTDPHRIVRSCNLGFRVACIPE